MTGIAKFYNKFLSFIELDPTRPDPTRGSTRPACNSALEGCKQADCHCRLTDVHLSWSSGYRPTYVCLPVLLRNMLLYRRRTS